MLKVFFVLVSIILVVSSYRIPSLPSSSFVYRRRGTRLLSSTFETSVSPEVIDESVTSSSTTAATSVTSATTTSLPYLAERRPLKTALLALAARTKRGEIANEKEKTLALELITKLEGYNPTDYPCNDELAFGKWELIYSNTNLFRSSPFWMAARAVCQEGDQASTFNTFCDLHRDALAFTNMGRITQIISTTSLTSEFETIVPVIPGLPITITGTIVSNSDIVTSTSTSWTLFMNNVTISTTSLTSLPSLPSLTSLISLTSLTTMITTITTPTTTTSIFLKSNRISDDDLLLFLFR